MSYRRVTYDLDDIRQVLKYYPGNFGAPGMPRGKKRERTSEEIEKANHRNKVRNLQRLIIANFRPGRTVHLTYRKGERPETFEEALQHRQKFMDRMRKICKKAGVAWKWIAVTERGKKGGALHHHLIIQDITDPIDLLREIQKAWTHGRVTSTAMEEEEDMFEVLAEYLVKKETKEGSEGKSYSRSRNLLVPQPKKETIHSRTWTKEPRPPKGWYIVQSSVWNARTPEGWPVQRYTMKRIVDNVDIVDNSLNKGKPPREGTFGGQNHEVRCGNLDRFSVGHQTGMR